MSKENRKNIPDEKKKQRNQFDTSADNILEDKPEGRHFNENVEARHQPEEGDTKPKPSAHLGAEDITPEDTDAQDQPEMHQEQDEHKGTTRQTTSVTAPEIKEEKTEEEEETLDQIKRDMTGG
jgi:hypothetical protein